MQVSRNAGKAVCWKCIHSHESSRRDPQASRNLGHEGFQTFRIDLPPQICGATLMGAGLPNSTTKSTEKSRKPAYQTVGESLERLIGTRLRCPSHSQGSILSCEVRRFRTWVRKMPQRSGLAEDIVPKLLGFLQCHAWSEWTHLPGRLQRVT